MSTDVAASGGDDIAKIPILGFWQHIWKRQLFTLSYLRIISYLDFFARMTPLRSIARRFFRRRGGDTITTATAAVAAKKATAKAKTTRLPIPSSSWDSHMHVVDPRSYPLSAEAIYQPEPHTLQDALEFEKSAGFGNIVLVQPSIYGFDNSCMLDAMRELGPERCRGVVALDPDTITSAELQEWHRVGVRGVRINLQSVGKELDGPELESVLRRHADAVREVGWVIQVYLPMHMIPLLEDAMPKLGEIRICIDHVGHPVLPGPVEFQKTGDPYELPGFESLMRLLAGGRTFVKLSAPYRISKRADAGLDDITPLCRELLRERHRVVVASDWPHTRFEGMDIRPWLHTVLEWCGNDVDLVQRLFRDNAEDLWQ